MPSPESVSAGIAGIALLVSVLAYWKASQQTEAARIAAKAAEVQAAAASIDARLPALIELLREFRSEDFTKTRHFIKSGLAKEFPNNGTGLAAITDEKQILKVIGVVHYFDQLGLIVESKLFPAHLISRFMGKAIEDIWNSLLPYFQEERTRLGGSPMYARNFDTLVSLCATKEQEQARGAA